jgi:hypothetical protein
LDCSRGLKQPCDERLGIFGRIPPTIKLINQNGHAMPSGKGIQVVE